MLDILVLSDLPPSPKVHHHKNYLKTRIVLSIDPVTTSQLPPRTQRSIFQVLTHGCVDKISRFFDNHNHMIPSFRKPSLPEKAASFWTSRQRTSLVWPSSTWVSSPSTWMIISATVISTHGDLTNDNYHAVHLFPKSSADPDVLHCDLRARSSKDLQADHLDVVDDVRSLR